MKRPKYLLLVLVLLSLLVGACAQTPTPVPTSPAAAPPTEVTPTSKLDTILQKGKMICGTSADFAPMEFVNEDGTFAGFDIYYIQEVGKRLGVKVEVWDMPFDSLVEALNEGKVDCLIAGMAPSAERDKKADFTIGYKPRTYVLVGKKNSDKKIINFEDVTKYRLGTQAGGIQVKWFQDNWVDKGLLPKDQLILYDRVDNGILDLAAGRIDFYFTQDVVSQQWAQKADVETAYIVPQKYLGGDTIICIPEGDSKFKAKMDEVITQTINDGTRNQLMEKWGIPIGNQ